MTNEAKLPTLRPMSCFIIPKGCQQVARGKLAQRAPPLERERRAFSSRAHPGGVLAAIFQPAFTHRPHSLLASRWHASCKTTTSCITPGVVRPLATCDDTCGIESREPSCVLAPSPRVAVALKFTAEEQRGRGRREQKISAHSAPLPLCGQIERPQSLIRDHPWLNNVVIFMPSPPAAIELKSPSRAG